MTKHRKDSWMFRCYLQYLKGNQLTVYHAYKNPSTEKVEAWERWRGAIIDYHHKTFKYCESWLGYITVLTKNRFGFTIAVEMVIDSEHKYFIVITPQNVYYATLEDMQKWFNG